MNRVLTLAACAALTLSLAACGGETSAPKAYDTALAQTLVESGAFSETLEALDADLVAMLYGLETAPESAAVYTSTGATAEEAAVLQMPDEESAEAALEAVQQRVADQKEACEGYLPAELPKLDQAVTLRAGKTVLLVVANDYDKVQEVLDAQ